jgi:hypothetical protein
VAIRGSKNRQTCGRDGRIPEAGSAGRCRNSLLATAKANRASTDIPATHRTAPSEAP